MPSGGFEVLLVEVEAALERPIRYSSFVPEQLKDLGQDLVKGHTRPSTAVCRAENVSTLRGLQGLVKSDVTEGCLSRGIHLASREIFCRASVDNSSVLTLSQSWVCGTSPICNSPCTRGRNLCCLLAGTCIIGPIWQGFFQG